MKKLIVLILFILLIQDLKSSPQKPDFLIIGKDTFAIFFLPLQSLDSVRQKTFFHHLNIANGFLSSFSLWRGYQAIWKIENNKLYLSGLNILGLKENNDSKDILKLTFNTDLEDHKIFADWFSSYLSIPKGKMLKWDGIFSRTYFKEELYEFQNGVLTNKHQVNNYIHVKNGVSRLNDEKVRKHIFKKIRKLNWKKLDDCGCGDGDKYKFSINEFGKITDIDVYLYDDKKTKGEIEKEKKEFQPCIEKFKKQLNNLQFDIITWNGKPYIKEIVLELFFDKRLENWTD